MLDALRRILDLPLAQGDVVQELQQTRGVQHLQGMAHRPNFNPQLQQSGLGLQGGFAGFDTSYAGGSEGQSGFPVSANSISGVEPVLHQGNTFVPGVTKVASPVKGLLYGDASFARKLTPNFDVNLREMLQETPRR